MNRRAFLSRVSSALAVLPFAHKPVTAVASSSGTSTVLVPAVPGAKIRVINGYGVVRIFDQEGCEWVDRVPAFIDGDDLTVTFTNHSGREGIMTELSIHGAYE